MQSHKRYFSTPFLTAALVLGLAGQAWATPQAQALKVSQPGDLNMNCQELTREATLMNDIIMTTQNIRDDAKMQGHGISAAGAIGSFLIGTVTGGVGLAAAGFIAKEASSNKADEAEKVQDVARQRRSFMVGIYKAKGCAGSIESVLVEPKPQDIMAQLASLEPAGSGESDHYDHQTRRYNQ